MSKRRTLLLSLFVSLCMTACGGVSQDEYDALKTEYSLLKNDYDKLDFDYLVLEKENENLKNKNDPQTTSSSFESLKQRLQYIPIESWAKNCYEGRFIYLRPVDDYSTHQIIVSSDYSAKDIKAISSELSQNISTFSSLITDDFLGETIYVKYLDSNGIPIVEYQLARKDKQLGMVCATLNSDHIDEFIEALYGGN